MNDTLLETSTAELPTKRMRARIVGLYGEKLLRKSALNIRDGAGAFEKFMSGRGIKCALEIGTYRGVSAAAMALFAEKVVTIDLHQGKLELAKERWDRKAFWQALGVAENIDLRLVKDDEHKKRLVQGIEFDFAFIDGDHGPSVKNDFALVRRCGRVLFHDYDRRGKPGQDCVCDFVDSLPRSQLEVHDIFALWTA